MTNTILIDALTEMQLLVASCLLSLTAYAMGFGITLTIFLFFDEVEFFDFWSL